MRRPVDIGYVAAITHDSLSIRNVPGIVRNGWNDYRASWRSHAWMAVIVLGVYAAARIAAAFSIATDNVLRGLMFDLAGLVIATALALPWSTLSLSVAQDGDAGFERAWARSRGSYLATAGSSLPFWLVVFLSVVLGLWMLGLFVVLWLPTLVFVIADQRLSALRALRGAHRVGRGHRMLIAVAAVVLLIVNAAAALLLGSGLEVAMVIAVPVLVVTTGASMAVGARLYLALLAAQGS